MSRKAAWLVIGILVLGVIGPEVVYAATGTFSSSSSSSAVTATNSSAGRAINASSVSGYTGVFARTGSGTTPTIYATAKSASDGVAALFGYATSSTFSTTYGVYGRSNADTGRGVYGLAAKSSGQNYGVYGQTLSTEGGAAGVYGVASAGDETYGVWGEANADEGAGVFGLGGGSAGIGVLGIGSFAGLAGLSGSGIPGDGTYGIISSNDFLLGGHMFTSYGEVAGTCDVAVAETTHTCSFSHPFSAGSPVVVVIPTADPTSIGVYWVANTTSSGFDIRVGTAPAGSAFRFNYVVVGVSGGPAVARFTQAALR